MDEESGIFTKFTTFDEVRFCDNKLFVMNVPREVVKGNATYMTSIVFAFSMN